MEPNIDAQLSGTANLEAAGVGGCVVGCVLPVLAVLGGFALAVLQNFEIINGWSYCSALLGARSSIPAIRSGWDCSSSSAFLSMRSAWGAGWPWG